MTVIFPFSLRFPEMRNLDLALCVLTSTSELYLVWPELFQLPPLCSSRTSGARDHAWAVNSPNQAVPSWNPLCSRVHPPLPHRPV